MTLRTGTSDTLRRYVAFGGLLLVRDTEPDGFGLSTLAAPSASGAAAGFGTIRARSLPAGASAPAYRTVWSLM